MAPSSATVCQGASAARRGPWGTVGRPRVRAHGEPACQGLGAHASRVPAAPTPQGARRAPAGQDCDDRARSSPTRRVVVCTSAHAWRRSSVEVRRRIRARAAALRHDNRERVPRLTPRDASDSVDRGETVSSQLPVSDRCFSPLLIGEHPATGCRGAEKSASYAALRQPLLRNARVCGRHAAICESASTRDSTAITRCPRSSFDTRRRRTVRGRLLAAATPRAR